MTLQNHDKLLEAADVEALLLNIILNRSTVLDGDFGYLEGYQLVKWPGLIGYLEPEHFFLVQHQWIYEAMLNLHGRGQAISLETVATELDYQHRLEGVGGMAKLRELYRDDQDPYLYYTCAGLILRVWADREQLNLTQQLGPAIVAHDVKKVDELHGKLDEIHKRLNVEKRGITDNSSITDTLMGWYDDPQEIRGYRTGIDELDKEMGGLDRGELLVVLGYSGSGKSTLLMQFALQMADQGHGLIVPTEMTVAQYQIRMVAYELGVDYMDLYHGQYRNRERLTSCAQYIESLPIEWFKDGAPTPDQINKAIRTIDRLNPLDWIIVDGVNDIAVPGADGYEKTTQAITALHTIARSGKLVACTAHMNRDSKQRGNKEPNPRDALLSSRIEQLATRILTIWRPGHMVETGEAESLPLDKNGEPIDPNIAYLRLAKSRFTGTGKRVETYFGKHQGKLGFHKLAKDKLDFTGYNGNGRSR